MAKLKAIYWFIIIFSAVIIPLTFIFIVTRILLEPPKSWWWLGGAVIIYVILGIAVGVIFLIIKTKVKKEPKIKLKPKDAREKAVYELKMDNDNPDNFIVEKQKILRVGMEGYNRTPILWIKGKGSEKNQRIDTLINLDEPEGETSWLRGATDQEAKETAKGMAEMPESEVKEERSIGIDDYGRPMTRITTTKQSIAEKKMEVEKTEADASNII